jgi:uncharacterized membrane protein
MTRPTSRLQVAARVLLGAALLFAGVSHLVDTAEFHAQVPGWVPLDEDLVVIASGFVEMALGAALIVGRHRVAVGWVVAGFFVAVFPGNISQYAIGTDAFGLDTDRERLARLFFQPVLVVWALWCTGAWAATRAARAARPQAGPQVPSG